MAATTAPAAAASGAGPLLRVRKRREGEGGAHVQLSVDGGVWRCPSEPRHVCGMPYCCPWESSCYVHTCCVRLGTRSKRQTVGMAMLFGVGLSLFGLCRMFFFVRHRLM